MNAKICFLHGRQPEEMFFYWVDKGLSSAEVQPNLSETPVSFQGIGRGQGNPHGKKPQVLFKLDVNVLMHEVFTVSSDNVVGCPMLGVFPAFQQPIYSIDFSSVCLVIPLSPQSAILYEPQGSIFPSGSSCWSQLQHPWIDWLSLCHLYLYSHGLSMLVPCQSPIVVF